MSFGELVLYGLLKFVAIAFGWVMLVATGSSRSRPRRLRSDGNSAMWSEVLRRLVKVEADIARRARDSRTRGSRR